MGEISICDACGCLHRARGFMCNACREAICRVVVRRAATVYRAQRGIMLFGCGGEARRYMAEYVMPRALPPIGIPLEISFSKLSAAAATAREAYSKLPTVSPRAEYGPPKCGRWWDRR